MTNIERNDAERVKRGPIKAGLLSFWATGLGQFYLGQTRAGLAFLAMAILAMTLFTSPVVYRPAGFVVATGLLLLALLGSVIAAVFTALRRRQCTRRWFHRWWVFLLYWGIFIGIQNVAISFAGMRSYSIPSSAQAPTLLPGDLVVAEVRPLIGGRMTFRRGDLILFKKPGSGGKVHDWIKRLVGLPGDRIWMDRGRVTINGQPLALNPEGTFGLNGQRFEMFREQLPSGANHAVLFYPAASVWHSNTGPRTYIVKPGHVFVLGDNRDNSVDSRTFGQVPTESIFGRARFVYWSKDKSRIGKNLLASAEEASR